MKTIAFIMGCTCVGKSSFLEYCQSHYPNKVGLVEVGKTLRAKYPPEHFKGQAAPEHTKQEAWQICESTVKKHASEGKQLILVDGQPRSTHQVEQCVTRFSDLCMPICKSGIPVNDWFSLEFIYFDASSEQREERMKIRHPSNEHAYDSASYALTAQRQVNDERTYLRVLVDLEIHNRKFTVVKVPTIQSKADLDDFHFSTMCNLFGPFGPARHN